MKLKKSFSVFIFGILFSTFSFADPLSQMNSYLNNFTSQLNYVIPNSATENNVYSDAWIGKFIPSLPMHFAVGVEGGVTKLDMSDLCQAAELVHVSGLPSNFVFPTLGLNAKLGGIILPFDVGLSFMTFNTKDFGNLLKNIDFQFFIIGGNVRFAILQGKGILPKFSIGAGYYYSSGNIGKTTDNYGISVGYKTHTLVAETQLSKTFLFITPFIGFRAVFSKSDSSYNWKTTEGLTGEFSGGKTISTDFSDSFIPQVFGGVGLKLGVIQLDVNASWDFAHQIWNGGTSIRFQL